ncbi:MAG: CPBP family intramembrane metalloprotease [Planctomycetes bacterium]|nr:CPBP family intramembrane metalloprotease [Planctomycetota bacterium]
MPLDPETPTAAQRALAGGVFLVVGLALVPIARTLVARIAPRAEDERVPSPWEATDVAAVILGAFLCMWSAALVLGAVGDLSILVQLLGSIATLAGAVLLAMALVRRAGARVRDVFALEPAGSGRAALAGAVAYLLLLPGFLGAAALWPLVFQGVGVEIAEQPVVGAMRALAEDQRPTALFLGVIVGPLCEELFFRGFLQRALQRWLAPSGAIHVASLAFAGLHGLDAFLPIFLLSLLLGSVAHATGRLSASFAVHALFNAQTFFFLWAAPEAGRFLEGAPPGLWSRCGGG